MRPLSRVPTIAAPRFSTAEPVRLSGDDPAATVWPAGEHTPRVIMQRVGEWCWIEVDDVASYRFPADSVDRGVRADAFPVAGVAESVVFDLYYRTVVPVALQVYGFESMHGTALEHGGGAVLLCAPSRTGKSTLAQALADAGWQPLADDGLVWEAREGSHEGIYLHPIPFSLMLRQPVPSAPDPAGSAPRARPLPAAGEPGRRDAVPVRAVLLLERTAGGEPAAARLGRREAFTRLLAPSYALTLADKERKARMMAAYLRLAGTVPVFAFQYPSGYERLPEVAGFVERLLARGVLRM